MRSLWLIPLLTALSAPAGALQVVDVADGRTVTVQVSARDLTRVSMAEGHRIVRVWGLEEHMTVEPDADGGQVFIRPAQGGPGRPFSFFVKDDAGATYTLVAVPVDMPADAIVLEPRRTERAGRGPVHAYVAQMKTLVRAMAKGQDLSGYTTASVTERVPLWNEAAVTLTKRYAGDLVGEVYRLENVSGAEMRLDERELGALARDIQAVAIDRHVLAPGESAELYLVRGSR